MAAIHDLIAQIGDARLRERLTVEWAKATRERKFGLVFEDHLPELLPLPKARPRKGDPAKLAAKEAEYKARFANPFVAGARGYIDDVIQPHETRKRICRSLAMLKDKKIENPWRKHGNIPL